MHGFPDLSMISIYIIHNFAGGIQAPPVLDVNSSTIRSCLASSEALVSLSVISFFLFYFLSFLFSSL